MARVDRVAQTDAGVGMNRIRVATVPDTHPYIDTVLATEIDHLSTATGTDPWAPSPLLAPIGLARLDADVVHVHFGYESLTAQAMDAWCARMRSAGPALVVTVHDLRNPHCVDRRRHDAHLGALLAGADEVITLTTGAAAQIADRWGRRATVLAHPTLRTGRTPARAALRKALPPARAVVGIHLKSLRGNVVAADRIVAAAAAGAQRAGARVRVDAHPDVIGRPELTSIHAMPGVDLRVHDRFDDEELERYLQEVDVSVLPYRFGSHSGWLELCRDLGTAVVAPDCGFYGEQWAAVPVYGNNENRGLDERSLESAVYQAVIVGRPEPADVTARHVQLNSIRAAHMQIYMRAIAAAHLRRAA